MSNRASAFHTYPQDEYTITDDMLKKSPFEVEYFPARARAESPRLLLEYVGANYTSLIPENWPASKKDTPFGMLPVLTHHNVLTTMMAGIWKSSDPTSKENIDKTFTTITRYLDGVERFLVKNGSNGYLLGEKTTYPEFAWYDWMDYFYEAHAEQMNAIVSETTRPALYRMYRRLSANPRLSAYIAGGRWELRSASATQAAA
ncbi:hypothetical protein BGZ98_001498 [Dissophora globulifera]|nr:hypothetical protein BGZ98_001498 [Dissophora globulifera]